MGGYDDINYLDQVEVLDLENGSCDPDMAPLPYPRRFSLGLATTGGVRAPLDCGGVGDPDERQCYVYDERSDTWNADGGGDMVYQRGQGSASVELSSGAYWITGGPAV